MTDKQNGESQAEIALEPTNVEKLRGLPWGISFDLTNAFFVQFTFFGSVFVLFLNDLGLNKTQIGFLLSLFPFLGLIALFIAPQVARFGYKRTFLTFWGLRTLITAGMLLTPWILARFGAQAVLLYVAGVTLAFAISRSTAMTALMPWQQEYIPKEVRGKYSATSNIFTSLAGLLAVSFAGYVIEKSNGLNGYMILFLIGVLFGIFSIYLANRIPGGAPTRLVHSLWGRQGEMRIPLRDHRFILYLVGLGLVTLATGPMFSFLPLFMQDKVGLSSGNVILLQTGSLAGTLLSSFLWGWAADRYGSKPVMLSGLSLTITLPVWWLLMPRQSGWSLYIALGIALLQGIASIGWGIGSARLLFVSIVPPEKKAVYMSQYNAWMGMVGGVSQLMGGVLLDTFSGIQGSLFGLSIDPYTLLFAAGFALPLISAVILRFLQVESEVSMGEFAGLFIHGNPFVAAESLVRYRLAKDEPATVSVTERLGQARSPLTVEELLEALNDPRFYVRFEAIVSIARHGPDARLMQALVNVLEGKDPALSVIAAWALGRLGDARALAPLRESLESPYRSIKAHAARSLGTLGDAQSVPMLLDLLEQEEDSGLQVAYASALGKLQACQAAPRLLELLQKDSEPESRRELSLALARLVGNENLFIQLMRNVRNDPGTTLSQAVSALKRKLSGISTDGEELLALIDASADVLARGDLESGAQTLTALIRALPLDSYGEVCRSILEESAGCIEIYGPSRMEYLVLAVLTIGEGAPPP